MAIDLLIINPYSPEFYYVPVGSVAIAAYLEEAGFTARIVNLAHLDAAQVFPHLDRMLDLYRPRRIGLVLHWKETLDAFLAIGDHLRRHRPRLPIWAGGLTASYFAEPLLSCAPFLDGVVLGDSEIPLHGLCSGRDVADLPNLVWRTAEGCRRSTETWTADREFLDGLRYGAIDKIDGLPRYLELIGRRLGLPLAPGRGCCLDCGYCGGSASAFRLHSQRFELSLRSPERVVDDLEEAAGHGASFFLLSHLGGVCSKILDEMARRYGAELPFALSLETWGPPNRQTVERFAALRSAHGNRGRYLLFTLRGDQEPDRRQEERSRVYAAARLATQLDPEVRVTVFSGYFSPWHTDQMALDEELSALVADRRRHREHRISSAFMALSTDPGSAWGLGKEGIHSDLDLRSIAQGILAEHSVTNNLLLHQPAELTELDRESFLCAWHLDGFLFDELSPLWDVVTSVLDFETYRSLLSKASGFLYQVHDGRVDPIEPFLTTFILGVVRGVLSGPLRVAEAQRSLLIDFVSLLLAGALARSGPPRPRFADHELPGFLVLDPDAIFMASHNFDPIFNLSLMGRPVSADAIDRSLAEHGRFGYLLRPRILAAQDAREMELLHVFDGVTSTAEAIALLSERLGAPMERVASRIGELWRDRILYAYLAEPCELNEMPPGTKGGQAPRDRWCRGDSNYLSPWRGSRSGKGVSCRRSWRWSEG